MCSWESMFECGKDSNAPSPGRLIIVLWHAFIHTGITTPRCKALRMIRWYQDNVSAGRNLCKRPYPYNCSERAAWMIHSYGLMLGLLFTVAVMWPSGFMCDNADAPPPERSCVPDCDC